MRAVLLGALALAWAPPARAAVVEAMELFDLCHDATRIVHGVVVGQESAWRDGIIITHVTVSVRRTLKGPAQKTIVVSRLGGVVGGIGQLAPGEADLQNGEEVVLFLEPANSRELRVVGMAQGVFHVERDGRAVQKRAGLTLVGKTPITPVWTVRSLLAAIARQVTR